MRDEVVSIIVTASKHYLVPEMQLKPILSYMKAQVLPEIVFIEGQDFNRQEIENIDIHFRLEKLVEKGNVVVESLYSWDELKIVQDKFGEQVVTVSIVADKELRYSRLAKRDIRPFTRDEAIKRDITEIENIAKAGPIAYADYFIDNNGTVAEFQQRLDNLVENINKNE